MTLLRLSWVTGGAGHRFPVLELIHALLQHQHTVTQQWSQSLKTNPNPVHQTHMNSYERCLCSSRISSFIHAPFICHILHLQGTVQRDAKFHISTWPSFIDSCITLFCCCTAFSSVWSSALQLLSWFWDVVGLPCYSSCGITGEED